MIPIPYPDDLEAKGWSLDIDYERVEQSDTWAIASAEQRPWLLMLWFVSWKQVPVASFSNDDRLIAARIGLPLEKFKEWRDVLMSRWEVAENGRLYNPTLTQHVLRMADKREKDRLRVANFREKRANRNESNRVTHYTDVTHTDVRVSSTPTPTPTPTPTKVKTTPLPPSELFATDEEPEKIEKPETPETGHFKLNEYGARHTHTPHTENAEMAYPVPCNAGQSGYVKTESPAKAGLSVGFEQFWSLYPKKVGKGAAEKAWSKAKINGSLRDVIFSLDQQKQSDQWSKNGGQFIPNPATWINEKRWLDEPIKPFGNSRLTEIGKRAENAANRWLESQGIFEKVAL